MCALNDLVVVLPGITGSTLYQNGRPVWEPSAGALINALRTLGGSLKALTLPDGIGDNPPDDGVTPVGLVQDLHFIPGIWTPIKGYTPLIDRLHQLGYREPTREQPGNLLTMPYDWRLSNRYTAAWIAPTIQRELERWRGHNDANADAQVVFVCHSMGGLVARWYAAHHGSDHTRMIITFGTPYRGSADAVEQLVNGAPGVLGGFFADLITRLSRSLPSLHQLLPAYTCDVTQPGEPAYLDPNTLPKTDPAMVRDGLAYFEQLETAESANPGFTESIHPIVGFNQPTKTTFQVVGDGVEVLTTYAGDDYRGDGTVALPGGVPAGEPLNTNIVHRVADYHGNLQRNRAALNELEGILTASPVIIRATEAVALSVNAPSLIAKDQPLDVSVTVPTGARVGLLATLHPDAADPTRKDKAQTLWVSSGRATTRFDELAPGSYTLTVSDHGGARRVAPVTTTVLVWDAEAAATE